MKLKTSKFDPLKAQHSNYAHVKFDGIFTAVVKNNHGLFVSTSGMNSLTNDLLWYDMMARWRELPAGTVYGELYVPGKSSSAVRTAIIENDDSLEWRAFAVKELREDAPLETVEAWCEGHSLPFAPYKPLVTLADVMACWDQVQAGKQQAEGYVLKDGNLTGWIKMKPRPTIDLIVTGWLPGEGKYAGLVGSLICSTIEGYEVAHCSGMTDEQREEMTDHADELVGQMVEVAYQTVGSQGRLRHPTFVRWRTLEDKDPSRCDVSQDIDLQAFWKGRPVHIPFAFRGGNDVFLS